MSLGLATYGLVRSSGSFNHFLTSFRYLTSSSGASFISLYRARLTSNSPIIVLKPGSSGRTTGKFIRRVRSGTAVLIGYSQSIYRALMPTSRFYMREGRLLREHDYVKSPFILVGSRVLAKFSLTQSGLIRLCTPHGGGLQRLLITRQTPLFSTARLGGSRIPDKLSTNRIRTIRRYLQTRRCTLVLKVPNTNGAAALIRLVQVLTRHDYGVLITSCARSTISGLLIQLRSTKISMLELKGTSEISHHLLPHLVSSSRRFPSMTTLCRTVRNAQMFKAAYLDTGRRLLTAISFSCYVISRTSRVDIPIILNPVLRTQGFVLIKSRFRLPPLIHDSHTIRLKLTRDLFTVLTRQRPRSIYALHGRCQVYRSIRLLTGQAICQNLLRYKSRDIRGTHLRVSLQSVPAYLIYTRKRKDVY